ncbi:MAG TPA: type II toxin-antitoxin system RelE/ParE family toxin [Phycisphaerae bacterium]|nr:type II toxin-antitoxin system RelE/ParE family toxin [Phycisphaerae bacterium]
MWNIELTDEFLLWWKSLTESQQDALQTSIELLESEGPSLGRPHADTIKGSRHPHMKELRTQCAGRPLRTFFAFDPRRSAILLIGGDKTGAKRFYDKMIPWADALYDTYLDELRKEGLL